MPYSLFLCIQENELIRHTGSSLELSSDAMAIEATAMKVVLSSAHWLPMYLTCVIYGQLPIASRSCRIARRIKKEGIVTLLRPIPLGLTKLNWRKISHLIFLKISSGLSRLLSWRDWPRRPRREPRRRSKMGYDSII